MHRSKIVRLIAFAVVAWLLLSPGIQWIELELKRAWCRNLFEKRINRIEDHQIIRLTFTKDQAITWEKFEKEFKHQGLLVDVIKIIYTDTLMIIYGVRDDDENELVHLFQKHFQDQNSSDSAPDIIKSSHKKYPAPDWIILTLPDPEYTFNFPAYSDRPSLHEPDLWGPPPKRAA